MLQVLRRNILLMMPISYLLAITPLAVMSDYTSERIRVLYIGEPMNSPLTFFEAMMNDPFFELTPVQASLTYFIPPEVARKSIRQYMPRNYEQLIRDYDIITLVYADVQYFDAKFKSWFSKSVIENNTSLTLTGHYWRFLNDWIDTTTVGDVLPVEMAVDTTGTGFVKDPASIKMVKPEHPLIAFLPWSKIGPHGIFAGYSLTVAKGGSEILAELVPAFGQAYPFIVWWDIGKGRTLAILTVFQDPSGSPHEPFIKWDHLGDFGINYHLFAAGRDIPPDVYIIHEIRTTMAEARGVRGVIIGIIEFTSNLGGDVVVLEQLLTEANGQLMDARQRYLEYDFEGSLSLYQDLVGKLDGIMMTAIQVKDQTFLWIYMVEWLILTTTSLASIGIVWSLMVKKRLYREVRTTRPGKRQLGKPCVNLKRGERT